MLACFIVPFTENAYFSTRIFYARQRIKYKDDLRIYQAFIKKIVSVWRHKVAWCSGYVTCLETFNLGSVLTKIRSLNFYTNVVNFFCNQF